MEAIRNKRFNVLRCYVCDDNSTHLFVLRIFVDEKSEQEWKKKLTQEEYHILRDKGTEPAFSGEYNDNKEEGMYLCRGCGVKLFSSSAKFDSESGWPSFYAPAHEGAVNEEDGTSFGAKRTEVLCSNCDGHLGHVFADGPTRTKKGKRTEGLRYCINSISLDFKEGKDVK